MALQEELELQGNWLFIQKYLADHNFKYWSIGLYLHDPCSGNTLQ